jgi:hypothetical protein
MVGGSVLQIQVRGKPICVMGNELPWRGSPPVVPEEFKNQFLIIQWNNDGYIDTVFSHFLNSFHFFHYKKQL